MSKIKAKDVIKGTIKSIDKSAIVIERTKDVLVNVKEKSENACVRIYHSGRRLLLCLIN